MILSSVYLGNLRDWKSAGVGRKNGVRAHMLFNLLDDAVLDVNVLKNGLDDHVHFVEF